MKKYFRINSSNLPIKVFLLTICLLFLFELALEVRAYNRGFDTFLFKKDSEARINASSKTITKAEFGPSKEFPFRSRIIAQARQSNDLRIWVGSASFAEASDVAPKIAFPNQICNFLDAVQKDCVVLNGSKASWGVTANIEQIKSLGPTWSPDYVLLYQMVNDIERFMGEFLSGSQAGSIDNGLFDRFKASLKRIVQRTTLYSHIRNYIGGAVLLSSQLPDRLPDEAIAEFKLNVEEFIDNVFSIGAKPILTTFIAQYDKNNFSDMPLDLKLQLMRYQGKLSIEGWMNSIEVMNEVYREVSLKKNIPLIDLEEELIDKRGLFKDQMHFTPKGHEKMAKIIAKKLESILITEA